VKLAKVLYGSFFVVAVPAALVWWATATAAFVPLPVLPWRWPGVVVAGTGMALMVWGMAALWVHGRGLPMNAFPPPVHVTQGPFRLVGHPIYVGFGLLCVGVSILMQSSSGLWLVSPTVALAMTALVLGFERPDLRARFGPAVHRPLLSLPPATDEPVRARDRLAVGVLVGLPWVLAFEGVCWLGIPRGAWDATLPFERGWPVLQWTTGIYSSTYVFVPLTVFIVSTRARLREVAVMGLVATAGVTFVYLTVPFISPIRPFTPTGAFGEMLLVERWMCHTVAAFPSFHVIWSLIAAHGWASRSRFSGVAGWTWACLIALTCVTTGMHAVADLAAAVVTFVALRERKRIWEWLRSVAERVANSWHAWTWHGVRLINYAVYAAAAATAGFWLSNILAGAEAFWPLVVVHVCGLVGAAAWAQRLEGSSRLSRPFGYYGSVIGAAVGIVVAGWIGGDRVLLLAVMAMAAPWVQAIGRLRCLVQGCCHGAPASERVGIRYHDPRSRVVALAGLGGVPLHPTPLYSILVNVVLGVALLRLWAVGASFGLVGGSYLMLAGITRFAEESLRGEPQTPVLGGLRLYQWMAVLSLMAGVLVTTLPTPGAAGFDGGLEPRVLVGGIVYGLLVGVAMGVDFPQSSRRFARLAPQE